MHRAALLLAAVLALAACGGGAGSGPDLAGEWEFTGGTADGAALPRPDGTAATLEVDGDELRGTAFCNHWFASYRLDGSSFTVSGLGSTEMGCAPDVLAAESAFLAALGAVDTAASGDDGLLLSGDGVELRFTRAASVPDSPLEGTRWVLETVVDGATASSTVGEPAVLRLDGDGTAEATTGCRTITGRWLLEDGALVIDDLLADGIDCPPEVAQQDVAVSSVLGGSPATEVTEDRLTLTADDGRGLVYRDAG
ncbi:META domain-containing protein [Blastococcus litoris]|uniref:META domain-containing protein n=1 Tax=Blastococcus litoris TaxID=2171622 RepID=UPI0013DFCFE5|nr:META domain-containing protein [Blastococcus litoris]